MEIGMRNDYRFRRLKFVPTSMGIGKRFFVFHAFETKAKYDSMKIKKKK